MVKFVVTLVVKVFVAVLKVAIVVSNTLLG